jgi:hypothetical protein
VVDRIVHQLVPEYDGLALLAEEPSLERFAKAGDNLDGRSASHGGEVVNRYCVTQDRGNLQKLDGRVGEVAKPADDQPMHGIRQLGRRRLDGSATRS